MIVEAPAAVFKPHVKTKRKVPNIVSANGSSTSFTSVVGKEEP